MTITAHALVKNEARFVWYSVMSVADYVDFILLWDTGSTDDTVKIIKEIVKKMGDRVKFREVGEITPEEFTKVKQEMLDETKTDWFVVVDGDEIWWQGGIRQLVSRIQEKGRLIESVVVPTVNLVGDMFHYQEEAAGEYEFGGKKGHFSLRAIKRNIPGLHSEGAHGVWGWADGEGRMIQDRDPAKILFLDTPYLHATHLPRGGERFFDLLVPKRLKKLKYELGISFPPDFYYPEVFFKSRPKIVPSVWEPRSLGYTTLAAIETPLKMLKRRLWPKTKVGY